MKLYLGIGLIIALGAGISGAIWWHNSQVKDSYSRGVLAGSSFEKAKWQTMILDSQAKAEKEKQRLETIIRLERKSWETRINDLKNMRTDCMPVDVLNSLRDTGIYTGSVPCQ